jgi:hypothetical protein
MSVYRNGHHPLPPRSTCGLAARRHPSKPSFAVCHCLRILPSLTPYCGASCRTPIPRRTPCLIRSSARVPSRLCTAAPGITPTWLWWRCGAGDWWRKHGCYSASPSTQTWCSSTGKEVRQMPTHPRLGRARARPCCHREQPHSHTAPVHSRSARALPRD